MFILRNQDDRWLVIRSVAGFNVPSKLRRKVAEFVARVNYGMILGYMEFDILLTYAIVIDCGGRSINAMNAPGRGLDRSGGRKQE